MKQNSPTEFRFFLVTIFFIFTSILSASPLPTDLDKIPAQENLPDLFKFNDGRKVKNLEHWSERRKELCFEGWRRNDLVRNGVYYEAINSSQPIWSNSGNPQPQYTPNEIRWPIPASELQINSKLVQNEGYN